MEIIKNCLVCGNTYIAKSKKAKYCSNKCRNKAQKQGTQEPNYKVRKIADDEFIEACKAMTIKEISDYYGVHHQTIRKRCRLTKCYPIGYNDQSYKKKLMRQLNERRNSFGECWHYISSQDEKCKIKHPDFEYIESRRKNRSGRVRLKCKKCKTIIERAESTVREKGIECEFCKEQNKLKEERIRLIRFFNALAESKKPKICEYCGEKFYSQISYAKYCSQKCKKKNRGSSIRKRCRKYGVFYDPSVKPIKVFERDGYICQICGLMCNPDDDTWGYSGAYAPTVDHILALKNGGTHTWNNVQCAHAICNSYKRDIITEKKGGRFGRDKSH